LTVLLQAVFEVTAGKGLVLAEIADGISVDDVRTATGCTFEVREKFMYGFLFPSLT